MSIEPRSSVVTIYTGDYLDRIRHLEAQAEAAREAADDGPRMLNEKPEYLRLAEEHDALVKEAEEKALHVRVQALRRSSWKALIAANPPRVGNEDDKAAGVNEDAFQEALIAFVNEKDPEDRTIVDGISLDDLDLISDGDFQRIYLSAFWCNRMSGGDPKASLVSRLTQPSDETSN